MSNHRIVTIHQIICHIPSFLYVLPLKPGIIKGNEYERFCVCEATDVFLDFQYLIYINKSLMPDTPPQPIFFICIQFAWKFGQIILASPWLAPL